MRNAIEDAQMLRDEARFALTFGSMLLALGFALALVYVIHAFKADAAPLALRGAYIGGPPILLGWIACRYAAWRLEEAIAIETRRPRALFLTRGAWLQGKRRTAALLRRLKQTSPVLAAKMAECQQNLRLYLVGEQH